MRDALDSVVPEDAIDATAAWFASTDAQLPAVVMPAAPAAEQRPPHAERLCRFGPASRLFGVLTPAARDQDRPTVLILNTGSNHHVGPNRLGVRLARALAAMGFPCFRFDVSGIGDSAPAEDGGENKIYSPVAIDDVREALAFLRANTGANRFALYGLCSGAYLAFHAADDPGVVAQVLVNLQTFKWSEGDSLAYAMSRSGAATRFYLRQLFEAATWKRLLLVKIDVRYVAAIIGDRLLRRLRQHASALVSLIREGTYEHSDVARRFARFEERGGTTLLVYSRDDGGIDVMEEHLGVRARKMRGRAGFAVSLVDGADHTFTPVRTQEVLLELVCSHLSKAFPGSEA
jgi:pimeloyl-ACP methyl ester carboxylesterase